MSADQSDYFEWAFKGMVGILGSIAAWLWLQVGKDVKELQDKSSKCEIDLLHHKIDAANTFAGKNEVQASFDRLYDRLDSLGADLKTVLIQLGNNKNQG